MLIEMKDDLQEKLQDDKFALKWVRHRHGQMKAFRETFEADWIEDYKQYRSFPDPRLQSWQTNDFIPATFSVIETILPRLVSGVFAVSPFFHLRPQFEEQLQGLSLRAKILEEQLENDIHFRRVCQEDWFRAGLIFGHAPAMVTRDQTTGVNRFKTLDVLDWWWDPRATCMDDMQDACHRVRLSIDVVKERMRQGVYPSIKEEDFEKLGQSSEAWPAVDRMREIRLGSDIETKVDDRTVTLIEFWTRSRVVTTDERFQVVLRNDPNELFGGKTTPYVLLRNQPFPGEMKGMSVPQVMRSLQHRLNDLYNLSMDNKMMAMCKMFAVPQDVSQEDVAIFPGAVLQMSDPSLFRVIDIPDLGQSSDVELDRLLSYIDKTWGVHDYTRGERARSNETATGIQSIVTEANIRFGLMLSLYMEPTLEVVRKMDILNQIWMEKPSVVRISNDQGTGFQPVSEGDYEGEVEVVCASSSTLGNRDMQRKQQQELVELVSRIQQLSDLTNWDPFYKALLDKYELGDVAGIRKTPEQRLQEQEQQQQMAMLQQQQAMQQQGLAQEQQAKLRMVQ